MFFDSATETFLEKQEERGKRGRRKNFLGERERAKKGATENRGDNEKKWK